MAPLSLLVKCRNIEQNYNLSNINKIVTLSFHNEYFFKKHFSKISMTRGGILIILRHHLKDVLR